MDYVVGAIRNTKYVRAFTKTVLQQSTCNNSFVARLIMSDLNSCALGQASYPHVLGFSPMDVSTFREKIAEFNIVGKTLSDSELDDCYRLGSVVHQYIAKKAEA